MITVFYRLAFGALLCALASLASTHAEDRYLETPSLAADVTAGKLPPVSMRLPSEPLVVKFEGDRKPGVPGGALHVLIASARDVRLMAVIGYARLVGYDENFDIHPDILRSIDVTDDRIFTLHLRPGHKWSDGVPFTAEDFRYYWEDVANNKELSPSGPPPVLLVDGKPPKFEALDAVTVRYTWKKPNPLFLIALASADDPFIYRPAHYLKRFHVKYADERSLKTEIEARRLRGWASLHNLLDAMYRFDNPDLPTLQPWSNITRAPATRFVGNRNPYFHRVDEQGHQLPYIDQIVMTQSTGNLIAAKAAGGEADLQARYLNFNDYTFLRKGEDRGKYRTLLWRSGIGAQFALYPNLNVADPEWRKLFRDVRFRRALSLGIDRDIINQSLYFGLAAVGNNTVLPSSPLYRDSLQNQWTNFDVAGANRLLDQIGLTQRDDEGMRSLPDGRTMELVVETSGEDSEQIDILQLIRDDWRNLGIKLFPKPMQRNVFRNRIFAGRTQMAAWSGLDNGIPTAEMSPSELAPTSQSELQWPRWGQYFETGGKAGEAPDLAEARELLSLDMQWNRASDRVTRTRIWERMLEINADQQFTIGVIRDVPQPVVVRGTLRNVPEKGIYNWDPGALFGIYRPDAFWFDPAH
jgi:peptide/nickel transport system substrate-binding protein